MAFADQSACETYRFMVSNSSGAKVRVIPTDNRFLLHSVVIPPENGHGKEDLFVSPLLVFRAYLDLIHFDWLLARGDFGALCQEVRDYPTNRQQDPQVIATICAAVDMACIWYWKEVRCLQRSAAATCLLKRHGVNAEMVIGARQMPFKAHAWVEVDGRVVNDKSYTQEMYGVLDRC
jgi:hypothetical protein